MNPNPPKAPAPSYLQGLREKRATLMQMPQLTPEQKADAKLAKTLQQDIVTLEQRLAGLSRMPRRPVGLREAAEEKITEELKAKHRQLNDVMRRIPFITL